MARKNIEAEKLNSVLSSCSPHILSMLSSRGNAMFFPELGIISQGAEAKGSGVNATIGIALCDDGSPMRLKAIAEKVLLSPAEVFSYASSFGNPELRKRWKGEILKKSPSISSEISLPVVSCALTHGLGIAGLLFADRGSRIITPDMFWENYSLMFETLLGARLAKFSMFRGGKFNVEGMAKKLRPGKNIVILNFPNNPTGYSPSEEEVNQISSCLREHAEKGNSIVAIADDAYFGLFFREGIFKESVFSRLCNLHERILAVKVDGPTKEEFAWGLRVGFITFGCRGFSREAYEALEKKAAGIARSTVSSAPNISQSLVLNSLASETHEQEKHEKFLVLKSRFEEVERVLASHPEYRKEFEAMPFNSGYFMCVKTKKDAESVRKILLQKYSVGLISFGSKILRIAFSSVKKEMIEGLFESLHNACREAGS